MKFYRVAQNNIEFNDCGKYWFTSRKEADRCKREWEVRVEGIADCYLDGIVNRHWATVEVVTIQPNKKGILWALNRYASDPSNG